MKRGAMLHADIEILVPPARRPPADPDRPGPGGSALFMDDGQQRGLFRRVSHWNMGRRLLDLVRPLDSTKRLKTLPDPGADETVRRWYVASSAFMMRKRRIELSHFNRSLELFPNDPEVLFFNASVHEFFAGVRMQSVMPSMKGQRAVTFDIDSEGAELWRAERLYAACAGTESDVHRGQHSAWTCAWVAWPSRRGRRTVEAGTVGRRAGAAVLREPVSGRRVRSAR